MKIRCRLLVPILDIRFSQEYIIPQLEDSRALSDVVKDIQTGNLKSSDFPEMLVWLYNKLFFTHDNRWLWILRNAGVEKVIVKLLYPKKTDRAGKKLMTFEHSNNYQIFCHSDFYPRFRSLGNSAATEGEGLEAKDPAPDEVPVPAKKSPVQQPTSISHRRRSWNYRVLS